MRSKVTRSSNGRRWTVAVAALCTVGLGFTVMSWQVPFVIWSAGEVTDIYAPGGLSITGVETYPVSGHLEVASVMVSPPSVRLVDAVSAFYSADRAVLPRAVSYPSGQPVSQVVIGEQPAEPQRSAEAAALRLAGLPATRAARVVSVAAAGPSAGFLLPDDVITAVFAMKVTSVAEFNQAVATHSVGDTIQLTVTRGGLPLDSQIDVVAQASGSDQQTASLGVTMTDSFVFDPVVVNNAPLSAGSGLMLALAMYDLLTPGPLLGNLTVAGAGMVDANGVVSGVAGTNQRLKAAQAAGATVFLLPASSCATVSLNTEMTVIAVSSLQQAANSLRVLAAGGTSVPTCQT
ncbi:MAG: PDZ domain-containing protein [Propionibacteriaceae bacterium]|nr:PDZ domain-containing protein [Propionibacteriaceae bacterium]